jgi:hypothetical protein
MADDKDEKTPVLSGKLVSTVAVTGGIFLLRKVLATAWTKITGKVPPTDLTDPKVTLPEALAWAVATGVVVETARFFMVRATMRRAGEAPAEAE